MSRDSAHVYVRVSNWIGNPDLVNGTCDASYMECVDCGHTRDITDEDLRAEKEEADRDRWNEMRAEMIDIVRRQR